MNISTSLNVFETEYDSVKAIQRCQAAGFSSLDFNYWDHQKYVLKKSWEEEEAWARHLRAAAAASGVRFTQMHGPVHGSTFSSMVMELNVESFLTMAERALMTASILGVPWVVLHPTNITRNSDPYKQVLDYNVRFYQRLFPVMERTGVGIALENMYDRPPAHPRASRRIYCSAPEELIELIDTLNHPLVGACWDTGHANEQGLSQDWIRELGRRLKSTHINDNDGVKDLHILPYQGSVDWSTVMEALHDSQYEGDFTYETHQSIRVLPDGLRDSALRYAAELGKFLVAQTGESYAR